MKQVFILVSAMFFSSIAVFAQEQKKEIKQSIQKEVFLEENNGERVLTIKTTNNGVETIETYKGEAIAEKLKEFESVQEDRDVREEISVKEENGEKTVTVTTTINGQQKVEVLTGEAAEKKLAEKADRLPPMEGKGEKRELKIIEERKMKTIKKG
jgi:hypothetical protein